MKALTVLTMLLPALLFAQNSAVRWSVFDMGFARPSTPGWEAPSVVGQSFVTPTASGNLTIASGFLADTLLRGPVVGITEDPILPGDFALSQNYPNPFNPATTIRFAVPAGERREVSLRVFDVLGREVATLAEGVREPGEHTVRFDATGLSSGPYFYRISAGAWVAVRKMMLLK